jgi:hypothetical protein
MRTDNMPGVYTKHTENEIGAPSHRPKIIEVGSPDSYSYSGDTVQKMALEPSIQQSQKDYIDGLGFAGLPTGSSHESVLEETGRSYGTSDFVGLTQRKFCKARQMAVPDENARTVPTSTTKEWCHIDMDELI